MKHGIGTRCSSALASIDYEAIVDMMLAAADENFAVPRLAADFHLVERDGPARKLHDRAGWRRIGVEEHDLVRRRRAVGREGIVECAALEDKSRTIDVVPLEADLAVGQGEAEVVVGIGGVEPLNVEDVVARDDAQSLTPVPSCPGIGHLKPRSPRGVERDLLSIVEVVDEKSGLVQIRVLCCRGRYPHHVVASRRR